MSSKKNKIPPFLSPFPVVCAHRGDSAHYPENTLPAFRSAAELGVDCIKSDVHLTADGECVLWHDDSVDRMTDGHGKIEELNLSELLRLDAGYGYEDEKGEYPFRGQDIRIPSLAETLEALPNTRFNLDLKGKNPKLVERFVDTLYAYHAQDRVLGASFHHSQLQRLRSLAPSLITSFSETEVRRMMMLHSLGLIGKVFPFPGVSLQVPEYFGKKRIVSPRLIKELHARGVFVQVWTVNKEEDMRRLLDMGVDGIITDDPRLLMKVVKTGLARSSRSSAEAS
jgi:glycerophosphoryl diester phosphodiesterase